MVRTRTVGELFLGAQPVRNILFSALFDAAETGVLSVARPLINFRTWEKRMKHSHVALVTGAGSGIGYATAIALAKRGFATGLLGRGQDELDALAQLLKKRGFSATPLLADVSDHLQMQTAIDNLVDQYGRLDAVIANAGINGTWAPVEDLQPDEWDETMAVNLRGTFLTIRQSVPHLKRSGGGSIVIVSSINGTRTFTTPGATAYVASKAAQLAITKQLSLELARYAIRVNAVCPGAIETHIDQNTIVRGDGDAAIPVVWPEGDIPLTDGKPGHPDDVAKLIAFLISDHASHITGTPIWIDGGQGLLR